MNQGDEPARSAGVPEAKAELRAAIRARLKGLSQERMRDGGAAICARVLAMDEIRHARVVMAFVPMRRDGRLMEADITMLLDAVPAAGQRLALPRGTPDGGLQACEVGEDWRGEVVESSLKGVMEPAATARRVMADQIDVVIVPGLSFDAIGARLGRGKGYYDRFLEALLDGRSRVPPRNGGRPEPGLSRPRPFLVGVCLDEQVVSCVPREAHDVLLDCVVTDVRTMRVVSGSDAPGQ